MIEKIVRKGRLEDLHEIAEDLAYWLSKPPAERVAAVEYLRRQRDGSTARLQRSARVLPLENADPGEEKPGPAYVAALSEP